MKIVQGVAQVAVVCALVLVGGSVLVFLAIPLSNTPPSR